MIGTRLAHYDITAVLGKGGMGEVYRATDSQLGREVALKILPAEFARDPERVARFEREARTLASLQHPDIAAIHGFESKSEPMFLVMELAEGQDLSERLKEGPLPVEEAVRIAGRLAGGLDAAHEKGVVHRDLKPANLKLTPERWVKILDFGLARAFGGEGVDGEIENSPTLTAAFTAPGVILGTAAYMSPEQARGQDIDKRADIWAFGVILWEMLTGERLFAGETMTDTLAAVLTREVDLDKLPDGTPPAVRHVLTRCLERDPNKRLRDIGEARLLLADPDATSILTRPLLAKSAATSRRVRPATVLPWVLLATLLAFAVPGFLSDRGGDPTSRPTRRFVIRADLPQVYNTRVVEISPDGTRIAVHTNDGLYVRFLDNPQPRLLVAAEDLTKNEIGVTPFWSPDSRYIAYGSEGRLWKVAVDGGSPQVVCQLPGDWIGGAWGADGTILFCTARGPIYTVSSRGGEPTLLIAPTPDVELDFHQPSHVADGGGFIFSVHRVEGVDTIELLRDGVRKVLLRIEGELRENVQVLNNPVYSPTGHILYQRDQGSRGLWAVPFDASGGEVTGDPFLISAEDGHPSVAGDGTLIYTALESVAPRQLVTVDRTGRVLETLTEPYQGMAQPNLSPDEGRVVFSARNGQANDIFVLDRVSGLTSRLTSTPGHETGPLWIPGTDRIAYTGPGDECASIWARNADGSDQPVEIVGSAQAACFSPDGRDLVYTSMCEKSRGLKRLVLDGQSEPAYVREHPAGIDQATLSPDGRFLTYLTWETGEATVEVARYPELDSRWLLAHTESAVVWAKGGREVYYISREPETVMAVELEPGPVFVVKAARPLFETDPLGIYPYSKFAVAADGSYFVFARDADLRQASRTYTLVENWFGEFAE